jgi:hypothetical protein
MSQYALPPVPARPHRGIPRPDRARPPNPNHYKADPDLSTSAVPSAGPPPARTQDLEHRVEMEWLISSETNAAITSYAIEPPQVSDLIMARVD